MPTLSPAEVDRFFSQGFLGPFRAFSEDEMTRVRSTIEEQVLSVPSPHCSYETHVRHLDSQSVFRLCSAPEILDRVEALNGPDLILWSSSLFVKPPSQPGAEEVYPWHQDWYNWKLQPLVNVSAWLAITPATIENGCMKMIPETHKQTIPWLSTKDGKHNYRFQRSADPACFDESKAVPIVLKAGEFILFNERTLHHSNSNQTDDDRIGLGMRFTAPFVRTNEAWPSVLLRGKSCPGRNNIVKPPRREPNDGWNKALTAGDEFHFDRAIPGIGWHIPENDGSRNFAWTSAESSWIDLRPVSRAFRRFECTVIHAVTPEILQSVEISINDTPLNLSFRSEDEVVVLHAPIDQFFPKKQPIRIHITTKGATCPCELDSESSDIRKLGLAIGRISLLSE